MMASDCNRAGPAATGSPKGARAGGGVLVALLILAVLYTLFVARSVLLPLAVAALLAILLTPVVTFISRWSHLPRWTSSMLLLLALLGLFAAGVYRLAPTAADWMRSLPEDLRQAERKLRELTEPVKELTEASREVESITSEPAEDEVVPVRLREPRLIDTVLNWAPGTLVAFGLTTALLYFLLASGDLFVHKLLRLMPTHAERERMRNIVQSVKSDISHYMLTITIINIGLGLAIGLTMWLLGMPNPALWGVLAAALNFVPYLGAVVGICLATSIAFVTFDELGRVVLVAAGYATLTGLEGNIITPSILGRRLPLNAVVLFVALMFWTWIWGIPGAFLAVPIMSVIKIVCDRIEPLAPVGELLGR